MQENNSLKFELVKIAFDKLLIGLIVLAVGFYASFWLESYKSEEAFTNELRKTQVERIGEVWKSAYLMEYELSKLQARIHHIHERDLNKEWREILSEIFDEDLRKEKWRKFFEDLDREEENFKTSFVEPFKVTLHSNRFWIESNVYEKLKRYGDIIGSMPIEFPPTFSKNNPKMAKKRLDKIKELKEELESLRVEVDTLRESYFK